MPWPSPHPALFFPTGSGGGLPLPLPHQAFSRWSRFPGSRLLSRASLWLRWLLTSLCCRSVSLPSLSQGAPRFPGRRLLRCRRLQSPSPSHPPSVFPGSPRAVPRSGRRSVLWPLSVPSPLSGSLPSPFGWSSSSNLTGQRST